MHDNHRFDQETFDYDFMEQEQRPFVRRLMAWVCAKCEPNLTDLGAGTGMYVEAARGYGWQARGYDLADPQPRPDLVETLSLLAVDDPARTVLCIEVAEHVPATDAHAVIDAVWRNTRPGGLVIWSAAQPGQGGVGHINCQPPEYWRDRALQQGFEVRPDLEHDLHAWITSGYHMGWFARNRQVWQRPLSGINGDVQLAQIHTGQGRMALGDRHGT